MLTRKQHELLRFIQQRLQEDGVPPSFDEMKEALDLRSKSGIHRLITALEERGFIRRMPNRARALEILKLPEQAIPGGVPRGRFNPNVIEGSLGRVRPVTPSSNQPPHHPAANDEPATEIVSIPVMGRIAAGTPISAIQTRSSTISLPPDMLGGGNISPWKCAAIP